MLGAFSFSDDYALLVTITGAGVLGSISGITGSLVLLKKQSLTANFISYATLPGIALAFIFTGAYSIAFFLIGAAVAGWLASAQVHFLAQKGRQRQDRVIAFLLSAYFGLGIILLNLSQQRTGATQAGLELFFFGQSSTMLVSDVKTIVVVGAVISILLLLFWKEFFIVAFDSEYAAASGVSVAKMDALFAIIIVANIVIGVQIVGIILMSAMLGAPAVAAKRWTNNIRLLLFLSLLFGAASCIIGNALSYFIQGLPTGPAVIICAGTVTIFSFFFAPKNGICLTYIRKKMKQIAAGPNEILEALYTLSLQHTDKDLYGHPFSVIQSLFPLKTDTERILNELCAKGLAVQTSRVEWSITPDGKREAEKNRSGVKR